MKDIKKLTTIIIIFSVVFLLGYDVFAIVKGGTEASISSIVITFAYKFPLMPFMVGLLCGHLFWRMKSNKDTLEIDVIEKLKK